MEISKDTPLNNIVIWQPRYHDNKVLIASYKVGLKNQVTFTKAKHLLNKTFYITGETIKKFPLETNGSIKCYAVPMDELTLFERV